MRLTRADLPQRGDACLGAGAFGGLLLDSTLNSGLLPGPAGVLAAALTGAAVAARTRSAMASLVASLALVLLGLPVLHAPHAALVIAMLGAATVAYRGSRLRSLILGLALVPIVLAALVIEGRTESPWQVLGLYLAFLLVVVAAADAWGSRRKARAATSEQKEAARQLLARELFDDYRLELAREIHDSVAHSLVAINTQAGVAAHLHAQTGPRELIETLNEVKVTAAAALEELRATLRQLRAEGPAPLVPQTLRITDVNELAGPLRATGVRVEVSTDVPSAVPDDVSHAAFRIAQESLTNVLRHARQTTTVEVDVSLHSGNLHLRIRDDGQPADCRQLG